LGEVRMVPSYDLTGPALEPGRYWRGPSWFNTAWLVHRGLVQLGERDPAGALRADVLDLAATTDFAEYVDPFTGDPRGARDFSWTAALALDLLADEPDVPMGSAGAGGSGGARGRSHG
jgi:glycogen debranching enzyme